MTKEEIALELTKLISDKIVSLTFHKDKNYAETISEAYNTIYNSINKNKEQNK
ncbi:hypothetical protein [Clostridium perfringens]|uniref:hypothetical protein n=1 Tax=Clostridium perfringens TaxID=1502 RepID=UPI003B01960F